MHSSIINYLIITVLLILAVFSAAVIARDSIQNSDTAARISSERQKELKYMVQQDCGSCHGMTLKGGLGPSLLPERVSVLPKEYLIKAITHGRQGTPMPPWEPILTNSEITWIVEQLQAGQLARKNN